MDQVEELAVCRRELQRLLAENAALRYSSESFGNLAERLKAALETERRLTRAPQPPGGTGQSGAPPHTTA